MAIGEKKWKVVLFVIDQPRLEAVGELPAEKYMTRDEVSELFQRLDIGQAGVRVKVLSVSEFNG